MNTTERRLSSATKKLNNIIKNESNFIESILEQCTEETDITDEKKAELKREYKLKNGMYVYKYSSEAGSIKEDIIISPNKIYDFKKIDGAFIRVQKKSVGQGIINEFMNDHDGRNHFFEIKYCIGDNIETRRVFEVSEIEPYFNDSDENLKERIPVLKEDYPTIIEYINSLDLSDPKEILWRNDLNKIFQGTDREVEVFTDDQIALFAAEKKLDKTEKQFEQTNQNGYEERRKLKAENENLQEENQRLKAENENLQEENKEKDEQNERLKETNKELIERTRKIKNFIVRKIGKIPFLGKAIIKQMNEELGKNELSSGER